MAATRQRFVFEGGGGKEEKIVHISHTILH